MSCWPLLTDEYTTIFAMKDPFVNPPGKWAKLYFLK
jgi:hypothetical protein